MMTSRQQKPLLISVALLLIVFIGGAYFVLTEKPSHAPDSKRPPTEEPTPQPPVRQPDYSKPINEVIATTKQGDVTYQIVKNNYCNLTFQIPSDWSFEGALGESMIRSPEDQKINEAWEKTHQDLINNEEGEAPLGPDARSLYISCQSDASSYPYRTEDLKAHTLKTIKIDGRDAYEISSTVKQPDGTSYAIYEVIIEKDGVLEIQLGKNEYDALSDTVKQIIQSISLES